MTYRPPNYEPWPILNLIRLDDDDYHDDNQEEPYDLSGVEDEELAKLVALAFVAEPPLPPGLAEAIRQEQGARLDARRTMPEIDATSGHISIDLQGCDPAIIRRHEDGWTITIPGLAVKLDYETARELAFLCDAICDDDSRRAGHTVPRI